MPDLRIDAHASGDEWEIRLDGDLDLATAGALTAALDEAPEGPATVLRLESLTFMDSSGLRALLQAQLAGRDLVLSNPRPEVLRVLQLAEVLDLFRIEPRDD